MNVDELVVERLALVLGVVPAGGLGVDDAELGGDEGEALALEPADDLADEATFDGVGLADDEGAIHGRGRLGDDRSRRRKTGPTADRRRRSWPVDGSPWRSTSLRSTNMRPQR